MNHNYIIILIFIIIYINIMKYRYKLYLNPNKIIINTPSDFGIEYKNIIIDNIFGWFYKNKDNHINNLIIYFNGNSGNISTKINQINRIKDIFYEYDIYEFDYPDFGLSTGELNINTIISSSYKVYDYWANKYDNIILIGESLGAGVISELLNLLINIKYFKFPKLIIHLNGITSLYKVINEIIPFIAKPFIIPWISEFNVDYIYLKYNHILPNILFIHAINDDMVPIKLVENLSKKLNKNLIKIYGDHNNYFFTKKIIKKIRNNLK